jgi:hypothetical protein
MAEPTQYSFDLREVTETLIRAQGIKSGLWVLSFELNLGVGIFGQKSDEIFPGAVMQISGIQLNKPKPDQPVPPWAVDAAMLT